MLELRQCGAYSGRGAGLLQSVRLWQVTQRWAPRGLRPLWRRRGAPDDEMAQPGACPVALRCGALCKLYTFRGRRGRRTPGLCRRSGGPSWASRTARPATLARRAATVPLPWRPRQAAGGEGWSGRWKADSKAGSRWPQGRPLASSSAGVLVPCWKPAMGAISPAADSPFRWFAARPLLCRAKRKNRSFSTGCGSFSRRKVPQPGRGTRLLPPAAAPSYPAPACSLALSFTLAVPCMLAAVPFEDGWRVEVKIRGSGTSLGTTDAVRSPSVGAGW